MVIFFFSDALTNTLHLQECSKIAFNRFIIDDQERNFRESNYDL
jgi:hypothetical protein